MAKGRPADPTRARRGTGNRPKPGEQKTTKELAVLPDAHLPQPPVGLPAPAQEMFRRIVAELHPRGLREADIDAIAMLAHSAWLHQEARAKIAESGLLVKGPRGPIVNPLIKVARDEAATYLRLSDSFGLTISSRLRLGLMQLAGESMLASLNKELDSPS